MQREIALAGPVVGAVQAPVERQDQADRVLGDSVRRIGGDVHHRQAERFGGGQVDVVVAGRAQGDQARAAGRQAFQHRPREVVVDEGADYFEALGEDRRVRLQVGLLEVQFEAVPVVAGLEALAVVGLAAEEQDAHGQSSLESRLVEDRWGGGRGSVGQGLDGLVQLVQGRGRRRIVLLEQGFRWSGRPRRNCGTPQ
ncbi:Uncharacterised protein [Pseudomonas aeruginosa]|nr:Uncharacterised protein [Pseudomonas aeruginosa]